MHGSPMKKLLSSLQATSTIHFCRIERFTVILYDKPVSPLSLVNEICSVRRIVPWIGFYQQKCSTRTCIQHKIFQAGIWTARTEAEPVIHSPDDFAWTEDELTNYGYQFG